MVVLHTPVRVHGKDLKTVAEFDVAAGQTVPFVLTHGYSHLDPPDPIDPEVSLVATEAFWTEWSSHNTSVGEWDEAVTRSLITLKALTYAPTGGIVAAPTTSLPEQLGGSRNWDYRFCWRRHAHAARADERRLLRRSARVARLAAACRCGLARADADHVRARRGAKADGIRGAMAARI
jgi:hypothetical protein